MWRGFSQVVKVLSHSFFLQPVVCFLTWCVLRSLFWTSNYVYWCKITTSVAFQPLLIQFTFIFESWIMVWLILNNSVLQSRSPSPFEPKHLLLPAPKLCLFGQKTTLFLVQDPLGDPLPPLPVSLSRSVPLSGSSESNIAQAPIEKRTYTMGSFSVLLCLH